MNETYRDVKKAFFRNAVHIIDRFHIAKLLEVDILPIYLYGTGKILPKKTYIFNKSPIHIEIGKRISINELDAIGNARSQAAYMRKHYIEKYEQLCNKIEQDV